MAIKQEWERKAEALWTLREAAQKADLDQVDRLIKAGADLTATDAYGATPLENAAQDGRPKSVALLARALPQAQRQALLDKALLRASGHGHWRCARALIEAGANPNAADGNPRRHNERPLTLAAMSARPQTVRTLLAAGADPNLGNSLGVTALMRAAGDPNRGFHLGSHISYTTFPAALQGQDPDGENRYDRDRRPKEFFELRRECLDILIEAGAALNQRDSNNISAALHAACSAEAEALLALARAGADTRGWDEMIPKDVDQPTRERLRSFIEKQALIFSTPEAPKDSRRHSL